MAAVCTTITQTVTSPSGSSVDRESATALARSPEPYGQTHDPQLARGTMREPACREVKIMPSHFVLDAFRRKELAISAVTSEFPFCRNELTRSRPFRRIEREN
jgi:hypothetical protein